MIFADPQRMIRAVASAVDVWARDNGFTVLFCSGNLALREIYENLRSDTSAKIILVDRTREKAKLPLFYPDLEARCKATGAADAVAEGLPHRTDRLSALARPGV